MNKRMLISMVMVLFFTLSFSSISHAAAKPIDPKISPSIKKVMWNKLEYKKSMIGRVTIVKPVTQYKTVKNKPKGYGKLSKGKVVGITKTDKTKFYLSTGYWINKSKNIKYEKVPFSLSNAYADYVFWNPQKTYTFQFKWYSDTPEYDVYKPYKKSSTNQQWKVTALNPREGVVDYIYYHRFSNSVTRYTMWTPNNANPDAFDYPEVVLAYPVVKGQSWVSGGNRVKILSTNATVKTPAGTFKNVVHVQHRQAGNPDDVRLGNYYYVKGIGEIKYELYHEAYESDHYVYELSSIK
ncbi:hypothetical protein [Peribacillus glennii]|uniref:Uncharacterized protein n=1 Tax=Peribacillus glennii TaxID=2303991 RepID=A0A372LFN0_9BACI|nr:hypothetical protein [Peribacillus glennii]RFU65105.1 hypothetical protein D0466_04120 [Peribacillus glennii]